MVKTVVIAGFVLASPFALSGYQDGGGLTGGALSLLVALVTVIGVGIGGPLLLSLLKR